MHVVEVLLIKHWFKLLWSGLFNILKTFWQLSLNTVYYIHYVTTEAQLEGGRPGADPPPAEWKERLANISITGVRNNKTNRVIVEIVFYNG